MANISNSANDTLISGTSEADSIYNYGSSVSIDAGDGDNYVYSRGSFVTVGTGAGNDSVYNDYQSKYNYETQQYETITPDNVTINAGAGDDSIRNYGSNVSISAGAGDDSIRNYGAGLVYIYKSGDGNDYIENFGAFDILIVDGADFTTLAGDYGDLFINVGNNTITLGGAAYLDKVNVTNSTAGIKPVNVIENYSDGATLKGTANPNIIRNYASNVTISGGKNVDSIYSSGDSVTIDAGDGDDSVRNYGDSVTIDAGAGDDSVRNYGDSVTIDAGDGDDSVSNIGDSVTINAGDGDNYVYSNSSDVSINTGAGDDDITNFGDNVTIDSGAGNDSVSNSGDSVSINTGDGNDTVYNDYEIKYYSETQKYETITPDNLTIDTGVGDDSILSYGASVSVNAGAGDDSVRNYGDSVTIDAGAGDDSVRNYGDSVTIGTGTGDDSVYSSGSDVLILASGGNKTVSGAVTVNLFGNNTVTGDRAAQVYQYTGGNNVITNYSHEDTIELTSGKIDSYSFDVGDLIFKIGDGSLRLKNMQGHYITITDAAGKTTTQLYGTGYSGQDVIKNLVHAWNKTSLSDTAKLDESIKLSSHFNTIQEVIDQMVADCRAAGDADTFLRKYCGIILDNYDTGAITGWDAGGASVKTADNVVNETLSTLKHVPDYTDTTFKTSQGVAINISSTGDSLDADGKKVLDGLYSWWADEAIKLVEESYGVEFTDSNKINFALTPSATYWGLTSGSNVKINMDSTQFYGDDDYNGNGVDRTIAHEFTHVAQNLFMGYFPQFLKEGLADLTGGIDDRKTSYVKSLSNNADNLATYLDLNNNGTGESYYYAAGYMFYRYLAKQASDAYDSTKSYAFKDGSSISGTDYADFLTGSGKGVTISAGKGNDTVTAYGEKMKVFGAGGNDSILISSLASGASIDGGEGNDSIRNGGDSVSIDGGAGNDSINNTGASVTVDGGEGNDSIRNYGDNVSFIYRAGDGNDTIRGFNATSTLSISGGSYSTAKSGYYNIIVTVGDGSITLTDAASLDTLNIATSILTLTNDDAAKITLKSGIDTADATARTKAIRIMGNVLDNSILGGTGKDTLYGQSGDDYINGGKGNDSLSGGDGDDTISGSAGDDVITGGEGNNSLSGGDGADRIYGGAGKDTILGGKGNDSLTGGDGDDFISGSDGNDTLKGITGNDTLTGGAGNDLFVYSAGNDVITDYAAGDKISLSAAVSNVTLKGSDAVLTIGKGSLTVKDTKQITLIDKAGKELTTILGGIVYDDSAADKVTVPSGVEVIDASARTKAIKITANKVDNSIIGGSGNDSISAGDGKDTLNGGAGNDSLIGGNDDDILSGGAGNDTLKGITGNDTLTGGAGNDLFVYSAGNDVITDYAAGDKISLSAAVSNATLKGSDAVLTIGKGSLTVKDTKQITLIDKAGKELTTILGGIVYDDSAADKVTVPSGVEVIDASARTKAIKITANKVDNSIIGGSGNDTFSAGNGNDYLNGNAGNDKLYGQAGDDTLWGGLGNDTLAGGKGADFFIYTGGNDIVTDFANDDLLQITGDWTATVNTSAVIFTVGTGSLTLKNTKATTFNVNGDAYAISGSKLVKEA